MQFRVLGPLEVVRDEEPVFIGTARKQRLLLAALLSRADRPVSMDWLIGALWGDDPPASPRRNVQQYVHRLRHALGAACLPAHAGRYMIVTGDDLDAARFRTLVAEGRSALEGDDAETATDRLHAALGLWRGPAYGEFVDCEPIAEEAARLAQLRVAAHEAWAQAALAVGKHAEVAADLADPVRDHPYRESLIGCFMLALFRAGRQSEALEVFRQARTRLVDQLGVEPGPELQRLHQAILRGDDQPAPPVAARKSPVVSAPVRELPADVLGFAGRHRALRMLDAMLPAQLPADSAGFAGPVVISAIAGTAGVGKTALAIHWAHRVADRFPDGQLFINLHGYAPGPPVRPLQALTALLGTLGIVPEQVPADVTAAASRYRSLLAGRRMLIVLDNAAGAEQVRPLLPGSPGCLVLVTSRDRLTGLVAKDGARRLTLDALTPAEAIDLLRHLLGTDRVRTEQTAAAELAKVCAYLPLALRIAAARLADQPHHTITDYLTQLRAFGVLQALAVEGDEDSAVGTAFDSSYRILPEQTRLVFRRFGLVPLPDFSISAVAALAGMTERQTAPVLDRLAGAHLIDQPRPGRYTLHDLLRRYAAHLTHAADSDQERTAATQRLLDWYLTMVRSAGDLLHPQVLRLPPPPPPAALPAARLDGPRAALDWLDTERHGLVAAVRHAVRAGHHRSALLIADGLRGHYNQRRHMNDWLTTARAALAASRTMDDPQAQASALHNLAHAYRGVARYNRSITYLTQAIPLFAQTDWPDGQISALGNLGICLGMAGRTEEALAHLTRAVTLTETVESPPGPDTARVLKALAIACRDYGLLSDGLAHATRAMALNVASNARRGEATTHNTLGSLHHQLGRLDDAEHHLTTGLAWHRKTRGRYHEANALIWLSRTHHDARRLDLAGDCATAALKLAVDIADRRLEAIARNAQAAVTHATGNHDQAIAVHQGALHLAEDIDARKPQGDALVGLAAAHHSLGHHTTATDYAQQALTLARQAPFRVLEGHALHTLADAQHAQGHPQQALQHALHALHNHRQTGHRLGQAHTHTLLNRILSDRDAQTADHHARQAHQLYSPAPVYGDPS
jgi:DNA-binding SARP family transcriptional activator/tetratricopeptide (TPR) repeat protein